jgi:hypothetical protein
MRDFSLRSEGSVPAAQVEPNADVAPKFSADVEQPLNDNYF